MGDVLDADGQVFGPGRQRSWRREDGHMDARQEHTSCMCSKLLERIHSKDSRRAKNDQHQSMPARPKVHGHSASDSSQLTPRCITCDSESDGHNWASLVVFILRVANKELCQVSALHHLTQ